MSISNQILLSGKVLLVEKHYLFMTSSIKIKQHTKAELDKLQAEILLKYDKKLTQQNLIELLLKIGKENLEAHFAESRDGENTEQRKERFRAILKKSKDWGFETNEEMIDDVLYGA